MKGVIALAVFAAIAVTEASLQAAIPTSFSVHFTAVARANTNFTYAGVANLAKVGKQWSVEGSATGKEGIYEYTKDGQNFLYTNPNNNRCLKQRVRTAPFLSQFANILTHATPFEVDAGLALDAEIYKCVEEKLGMHLFSFDSEHFVMCNAESVHGTPVPKRIIGKDVVVTLGEFKHAHVALKFPKECKTKVEPMSDSELSILRIPTPYEHVTLADAWFTKYQDSCHLEWTKGINCDKHIDPLADSENTKKVCIFLHGAGNDDSKGVLTSFTEYWGDVAKFTPQCSERYFIRENTKRNGWNAPDLQQKYCALALRGNTGKVVKNKIIFAHSMGNLILASAIRNGICDIDRATTSWYNVQGPLRGSKAAQYLEDTCSGRKKGPLAAVVKGISTMTDYCIKDTKLAFPAYAELRSDFCSIKMCMNQIATIVQKYAKGSLCGTTPKGLNTKYALALSTLSGLINYGEENDGLVPLSSCLVTSLGNYGTSAGSANYKAAVNHADGTCRNGNGLLGGSDRKPCDWYTNKY
jgi:hypothetical protein